MSAIQKLQIIIMHILSADDVHVSTWCSVFPNYFSNLADDFRHWHARNFFFSIRYLYFFSTLAWISVSMSACYINFYWKLSKNITGWKSFTLRLSLPPPDNYIGISILQSNLQNNEGTKENLLLYQNFLMEMVEVILL